MTTHVDTYEQTTTTTTTTAGPGAAAPIGPQPGYVRSQDGILKIVEMILCIIVLICASIEYWFVCCHGGGWVQFVACSALITTLIIFLLHFLNIAPRLPFGGVWPMIKFIYYCVYVVLFAIAGIVAAVKAGQYANSGAVGAAAFFVFATMIVYAIDAFFMYRGWQTVQHPHTAGGTTVTTTVETRQY